MTHIPSFRDPKASKEITGEAAAKIKQDLLKLQTPQIPSWKKKRINEAYKALIREGRILLRRDPYNDGNFTENVVLPPSAADIKDAVDAYVCDTELVVRRRDGKAFAWSLKSMAPLGPR